MFKKIFTSQQLSLFLQAGALINIIGLFLDLIIYHYFSDSTILKIIAENLNTLSIFMICIVIISQAVLVFFKNHEKLFAQYPIAIISIEIVLAIFCLWVLTVENDIEGKFIIFYSSMSRLDHSYKIMLIIATLTLILIIDFYRNLKDPAIVDDQYVPNIVRSSFQVVIRKHIILLLFVYGIIHFKKIHKFSVAVLHYSQSTFLYDLTLLEILIPISWIAGIVYYVYTKFHHETQKHKNLS